MVLARCGIRRNSEVGAACHKAKSSSLEFRINCLDDLFLQEAIGRLGLLDPHERFVYPKRRGAIVVRFYVMSHGETPGQHHCAQRQRPYRSHRLSSPHPVIDATPLPKLPIRPAPNVFATATEVFRTGARQPTTAWKGA